MLKGGALKFGDNISTDLIAPGRLFHLRSNLPEMAKHTLEDADPDFPKKVKEGDFVVGGFNFGCGSSREHAPRIIKLSGIKAVLSRSFARIFYRNCFNIGLYAIQADTSSIRDGDSLEVNLERGKILIADRKIEIPFMPIPEFMRKLVDLGGLKEFVKQGGFNR
ncbi:MAG TPA: 3-isopropylmalate dehydratase [bacterium]|nr:3-isopropylmalate dehydratase [bacterium]